MARDPRNLRYGVRCGYSKPGGHQALSCCDQFCAMCGVYRVCHKATLDHRNYCTIAGTGYAAKRRDIYPAGHDSLGGLFPVKWNDCGMDSPIRYN